MNRRSLRRMTIATALMLLTATSLYAQDGTKKPVPHNQTISANPFGLMLRWFNVEYERKLTGATTLGVSASTYGWDDADLTNGHAFVRYYPQGAALTGFFLGARTGVTRGAADGASATGIAAGMELGYSWLFGSRRNVGVSLGFGIDRIFLDDLDIAPVMPNIRLVNVGIAF